MKFIKPFSSFKYCMNYNNSIKSMWKMALKDPVYIVILVIELGTISYLIISLFQLYKKHTQ